MEGLTEKQERELYIGMRKKHYIKTSFIPTQEKTVYIEGMESIMNGKRYAVTKSERIEHSTHFEDVVEWTQIPAKELNDKELKIL
jgi:hypothetical protein